MNARVKDRLSKLTSAGFFHVFGSSSVNKVLSFACGVLVVRILSQSDYGAYAYAYSILNVFLLFNGLGASSAILQLCSEAVDAKKRDEVSAFGFKFGLCFDCLLCLALLLYSLLGSFSIEASGFLLMLFLVFPVPQFVFDAQSSILRSELKNREFAWATNINTLFISASSVLGAYLGGAIGLIVGRNIAAFSTVFLILILFKAPRAAQIIPSCRLDRSDKVDFIKLAVASALNNGLGQLTYLVGTLFVGALLANPDLVAMYQIATVIPNALTFLPMALITFAYPYFAQHKNDHSWTVRNYARFMVCSSALVGGVSLLCILFAPPIITLAFGEAYAGSVDSFRILMLGFLLSGTLRIISGNLLVTQRKLAFNTMMLSVSMVLLVGANVVLVPFCGIEGAALSQAIMLGLTGLASTAYYVRTIAGIST